MSLWFIGGFSFAREKDRSLASLDSSYIEMRFL